MGQTSVRERLEIRATDGHPFRILSVSCDNHHNVGRIDSVGETIGGVAVSAHEVQLRFTPSSEPSFDEPVTGSVQILTDRPNTPRIDIPWSAFLRHSTATAVSRPLDFVIPLPEMSR
jgi:hypothetical protein